MSLTPAEYIEFNLGSWVISDPEFKDKYECVSTTVKTSDHLDGFMSTIFLCELVLIAKDDGGWVQSHESLIGLLNCKFFFTANEPFDL